MRLKLFLLAVAVLLLPSSLQAAIDAKIIKHTLPNGIRVFIYERHTFPTVSFYIGHKVGAVDDGVTGASHFLEHLLFKGTAKIGSKDFAVEEKIFHKVIAIGEALDEERAKGGNSTRIAELEKKLKELSDEQRKYYNVGELAQLYSENGATGMNAFTSQDSTLYTVSLPNDKLKLWARIEADRRKKPVFREFYAERNVVAQERIQRTNSVPGARLNELFFATAFTSHPYRNPIIGLKDDINSLRYKYMMDHFKNFYSPQNTVIVIVGDVDAKKAMATIYKYFGDIPRREVVRKDIVAEPLQLSERRADLVIDANEQIAIGFHKPAYPHRDNLVFDVITNALSSGRSSRLQRRLVEVLRPMAGSVIVSSGTPGIRYDNLFCIYATPLRSIDELETTIYDELEKIAQEGISSEELKKVKTRMRFGFISILETNSGLAGVIATYATVLGDTTLLDSYLAEVDKVTTVDVKRVARKYLTKENRTVVRIKKK